MVWRERRRVDRGWPGCRRRTAALAAAGIALALASARPAQASPADACAGLLALLAEPGAALTRTAIERAIDPACATAAAEGQTAAVAPLSLLAGGERRAEADAAGHALCILHPPAAQALLEQRLERIRWGGYWRDPDDTARCLLGLMRIGAPAAAAVDRRLVERGYGRDALGRLLALASDAERERLAPLLSALGPPLPGLDATPGRDELRRGLCQAHAPRSPALARACDEVGPELDPDWRTAVRAAEERAAHPRLARRLLVTGGIVGAGGALLAAAAAFRSSDGVQLGASFGGVVSGAALGLDAGLLVGRLCTRDSTSCAYQMIGTALIAAPLLAIGGGVGSYYASRDAGWARVTTVGTELAVVVPHLLYWNWAF